MVTKAQLDAALSDLEKKLRKEIDLKFDAGKIETESKIGQEAASSEGKRETIEDEIYEETDTEIDKVKKSCARNRDELHKLKEQLIELEKSFDRFRSQHGAEDIAGEEPGGDY